MSRFIVSTVLYESDSDEDEVPDRNNMPGLDATTGQAEHVDDEARPFKRQRTSSITEIEVVDFSYGNRQYLPVQADT
jgi:hypothetical protein